MSSTIPLRERKKDQTRFALASAALILVDERGLAAVRIDDIAERAGVAVRTFRNYFSSKEAAVVGLLSHNYDLVGEALGQRPEEEELWLALANSCAALYPTDPDRAWVRRMRLLRAEPALAAELYRSDANALDALSDQIKKRKNQTGQTVFPRLAAEVVQAALRSAIDYWLNAPNTHPLREIVFDFISRISIK